jgi:hypothetical protein
MSKRSVLNSLPPPPPHLPAKLSYVPETVGICAEWRRWAGFSTLRTGDEPGAEHGQHGGARERRDDLGLRQPLRHEPRQLQLRRRVRVAMSAHSRRLVFWTGLLWIGVGEDDGRFVAATTYL